MGHRLARPSAWRRRRPSSHLRRPRRSPTSSGLPAEYRVPLVPQGGNTGMAAGATPPADGSAILLSMRRMNNIRSISAGESPRRRRSRSHPGSSMRRRMTSECAFR